MESEGVLRDFIDACTPPDRFDFRGPARREAERFYDDDESVAERERRDSRESLESLSAAWKSAIDEGAQDRIDRAYRQHEAYRLAQGEEQPQSWQLGSQDHQATVRERVGEMAARGATLSELKADLY